MEAVSVTLASRRDFNLAFRQSLVNHYYYCCGGEMEKLGNNTVTNNCNFFLLKCLSSNDYLKATNRTSASVLNCRS